MPSTAGHPQPPIIITIDGPAGTGKSTVAHHLARRLGLEFLDTGAMYRAAALLAIERRIDPAEGGALAQTALAAAMHFDWQADPPRILIGERDVSRRIREADVNAIVSIVAAQPELREVLVREQRRIALQHSRLVTEGRDQGSVVFPDAPVRFYLDADPAVRARRRADQLIQAGKPADAERVLRDIRRRDALDASRSDGPLIRPPGAIAIDTTDKSIELVVAELERAARRALPQLAGAGA